MEPKFHPTLLVPFQSHNPKMTIKLMGSTCVNASTCSIMGAQDQSRIQFQLSLLVVVPNWICNF